MTRWKIVLTDRSYTPVGELTNFGDLSFTSPLSKLATASFSVRLDAPKAQRLIDCDGFVKLYRDTSLQFFGPLITSEAKVERAAKTLAVTCADAGWILAHRLAGKSASGALFASATDRAQIAKSLIDTTNTMSPTGISTAVEAMWAGAASTYVAGPYRPVLDCVSELGSPLDGFDWQFVPIENWSDGSLISSSAAYIRALPIIGQNRPNAVFEYGVGTRANVLSFAKSRSRDSQLTRAFHITDPSSVVQRPATEPSAAQTEWGYLEGVVDAGGIVDLATRQSLLDEHLNVRGTPRDIYTMTPHIDPGVTGRIPQPFVDYFPGDSIQANILNGSSVLFSGLLRVYAINVSVENETGFERVTLTLEDES